MKVPGNFYSAHAHYWQREPEASSSYVHGLIVTRLVRCCTRMATPCKRSKSTSTESGESCSESCSTGDSTSRRSQKRQYRQTYRPEWEEHDDLRGWLAPSRTKRGMAFCKLCNCNLEAKLSDLRRHISTKKHSNNAKLITCNQHQDSLACVTLDSKVRNDTCRCMLILTWVFTNRSFWSLRGLGGMHTHASHFEAAQWVL